ncbi:uncharacterized protein HaLaN_08283, partial [Haematococcus lacustris]
MQQRPGVEPAAIGAAAGQPCLATAVGQIAAVLVVVVAGARGPPFPAYGFQLLGFDFLLDEALQPWLLEVNSAPSIMALHDDPGTADMIRGEKLAMLNDLVAL